MRIFTNEDAEALAALPVIEYARLYQVYNPTQSLQQDTTGSVFVSAYLEAADFLNYMFTKIEEDSPGFDFTGKNILDFGCGWGRMLRLLLMKPQFKNSLIYGLDQNERLLRVSQCSIPSAWIIKCGSFPPCNLRDQSMSVIYAYSVFSHFNERPHLEWAREFHRMLEPGGYASITLQARRFIGLCKQYREGTRPKTTGWHELLAGAFLDDEDCFRRYDAGELVFNTTGGAGMDATVYGDAVVPRAFVEKHWGALGFQVIDWTEIPEPPHAQTRVVLKKI